MVASNFNGLFAPAGLSPAIVGELAQATRRVMDDAEFQRTLATSGFEPIAESGPQQAQRLVRDELARWTPIMKSTNFKLE
jgi:tripartite-type tricarboxylate transporter receptor subunit TctC